ncbi:MAG: DUF3962 domain-containing protein [Xenococcaceae cyanobacterium MO_167.B27]|nr:DUF3962 domain-containing protein [Xenococcaceae cyanobacterium MO_167.B27]
MSFNTILPGAYSVKTNASLNLFTLTVPIAWQQAASTLAKQRVKLTGKGYPSVPVYSLNSIVSACFPQIIQTAPKGWQHSGVPWILSSEQADLDLLPELIKDGFREEFTQCLGEEAVEATLNNLKSEAWQWSPQPTTYSSFDKKVCFQALPDFLAKEFLKNPTVSFGAKSQYQLTFYRVANTYQGAELMSWPPYPVSIIKNKKEVKKVDISFVISLKLQTFPWSSQLSPVIVPQLSIRRWFSEPKSIPYRGATAYIGDNRRWLDGEHQPFCFMRLAIKRRGQEPSWHQAIANLLKIDNTPLPNPKSLAAQPTYNWLKFKAEERIIQGAISYDTRYLGEFPCFPGVSPLDLASLDQAILKRLPLHRIGEAVRVGKVVVDFWSKVQSKKKSDKSPKKANERKTPMLRPQIAAPPVFRQTKNPVKTILILWSTNECRDALITEICQLLSLSPEGETQTYVTSNGAEGETTCYQGELGSITIKTQHVEDLAQKLDVDNPSVSGNNRQQRRVNLLEKRIKEITSALPKSEGLSGALVEIKPKAKFFPPESDPKLAWRIGAMRSGYINQHINPITDHKKDGAKYFITNGQERIKRAVSDLWRQFGILPIPLINEAKDGVDPNLWLTCFYVLRRTRKTTASNKANCVALMLRVNPITGMVEMTTPSWFSESGWVSYSDGLGSLLNEKWDPNSDFESATVDINQEESFDYKKHEQQFLNQFVINCLLDCLSQPLEENKLPRVLFMAEAQNARRTLTWLQNPKIPANKLPSELHITGEEKERLWMARLRIAKNGEVPFGIVKDSSGSRTSGIFQWQDICKQKNSPEVSYQPSLYLSMRKLLTTEQGVLGKSQSRLDDSNKQAANTKPLEIAIVHHPGIDATDLASLIHNLRSRWPYFPDSTSLPFPFPFATSAKEYAVGVKDAVELDTDADEEEVEVIQLSLF